MYMAIGYSSGADRNLTVPGINLQGCTKVG